MKFFLFILLITYSYQYLPKGCTCLNGNQNIEECTDYDCRCACDLTNVCDSNCCCDEDCSEDERSLSYELGQCVFSGAETSRVRMCRNNDYFQKVNSYTNMRVTNIFDNLMCVEVDNNPSKGNFYVEPDSSISFPPITPEPSSVPSNLINEFYVTNSDIYVSVNETENEANEMNERELQTITVNNKEPLIFLTPGFSNLCLKSNRAKFMNSPIKTTNCLYEIKQNEVLEDGILDPAYYTNMMYYTTPNGTAKNPIISYNGGDLTKNGNNINDVVNSVNYIIKYTYDTTSNNQSKKIIDEFDIAITTTNIANIQYPYYHPITSTIQFVDISSNTNNIVMQRSGNPGYLKGRPILCANSTSDSCINNHLSIPIPTSNGRCNFANGFSALNFGSGYVSYCYITGNDIATVNNGIAKFNGISIGKYGNSDYNNTIPEEWIRMEVSSNCPAASSTSAVSVITFHFVTSYVGAFPNAQEIIIKSQVSCENSNYNANGFYLKVAAVFDRADIKKFKDYTPPKPKLRLKLPADIFRPFLMKDVED